MDHRSQAGAFLVSRRAKLTPEQASLPAGTNRRVPGLRRSEVAALAGVSIEYYAKLERGALAGVSAGALGHLRRHPAHRGTKTFHHPIVGELTLAYEGLELAAEPGLTLTIYTAEPGSPSQEALRLLAGWTSTPDQAPAVPSDSDT